MCPLINYALATEENVRNLLFCACCNHLPITSNEFYHNTQPKTISKYSHKVHVSKGFLGKISAILPICIMKKINLEVTCKRNRYGYWNSCKRLLNLVNVAALHGIYTGTKYPKHMLVLISDIEPLITDVEWKAPDQTNPAGI